MHDALAVWVAEIVHSHECIVLLDEVGWCRLCHAAGEVLEAHPVQAVLSIGCASASCLSDYQLVALGHVVVIAAVWHSVVLLHHDVIVLSERIVQLSPLRIEIYLTRLWVVMVNLHHASEDAVIVFSQEL